MQKRRGTGRFSRGTASCRPHGGADREKAQSCERKTLEKKTSEKARIKDHRIGRKVKRMGNLGGGTGAEGKRGRQNRKSSSRSERVV